MSSAKRRKVDTDVPLEAQRVAEPASDSSSPDSEEPRAEKPEEEVATKSFKDLVKKHLV
jgi:hypothetical protein